MGVVAPLAQRPVRWIITRSTIQLKSPGSIVLTYTILLRRNNGLAWFIGLTANFSIAAVVDKL